MKLPGFLQRNKSDESAVPEDLQQYYSANNGGAGTWILRAVLAVAALALLIWAGLWLFNKLTGDDEAVSNPTTAQQENNKETNQAQQDKAKADAEAKAAEESKKAEEARKKAADEANEKIAAAQRDAAAASPTPTPAPTPAAGATPAPAALPNSGPSAGILAGIFAAVTALGTFAHSMYLRRHHA